jgi:ribulose-5-phosphate 4-epimerase/fuculose-1-phosphate aldolase
MFGNISVTLPNKAMILKEPSSGFNIFECLHRDFSQHKFQIHCHWTKPRHLRWPTDTKPQKY